MRYYKIRITSAAGGLVTTPSSIPGSDATYTSFANNRSIPSALQVELDIPLKAYATPMGGALVRIWGVSLAEIAQSTQLGPTPNADGTLDYKNIAIYGGMQKGLPLANPAQAGLLVEGSIIQAFGNWLGTDQSLDIILAPVFGTNTDPKNITFNWLTGTPLADAIRNTLKNAFPKYAEPNIQISPNLVLNHDEPGFYNTIEQFAAYVKQVSISIIGGGYSGVDIFLSNNKFNVFDGTTSTTPKQIAFQDLIGQPTWIGGGPSGRSPVMQFKTVMRGDISMGDYIKMPQAFVTNTAAVSTSLTNLRAAFQGSFFVNEIRHVGNFRQPDGASWVTTFNASPLVQQANQNP